MPKIRPPYETWVTNIRPVVWKRDKGKCTRCGVKLKLNKCHIDHIISGKDGSNKIKNLRTLCKKCHILRLDFRHRTMINNAVKVGVIPPDWRNFIWDE